MTRRELLSQMSIGEFIDWIAFFRLEQQDQEKARQDAEDRAQAQRVARQMSGFR